MQLTNSTISENSTNGLFAIGSGLFAFNDSISLINSTVSSNVAEGNQAAGAGLYLDRSHLSAVNSTIVNNRSDGVAGGISITGNDGSSFTIDNSIVAGNIAARMPDFNAPTNPDDNLIVRSSLIGSNSGTGLDATAVDGPDQNGNLIGTPENPLDPRLGPLTDNGGRTETHGLLDASPTINAGDIITIPESLF